MTLLVRCDRGQQRPLLLPVPPTTGFKCHIKHLFLFTEDPLAIDPLTIKMEFKIEPTEDPEELASPDSQEALSTPGTSASIAGKS